MYYVVVIFPLQKMTKIAEIAILDIWQKLQKRPRILKTLQNSPEKITELTPQLSDFADRSLREQHLQLRFFSDFWVF